MAYKKLIIALHTIIPLTMFSMHHAPPPLIVVSSDKYVYSLSEEKATSSRFLAIAQQQSNPPHQPLSVPFLKSSLNLFFDAYDARNDFDNFFNRLSPQHQNELISLAGHNQLASPLITYLSLQAYCGKTITSCIMPAHMEIDRVINYLYNEMVQTYVKHRQPIKKKNQPHMGGNRVLPQNNKRIKAHVVSSDQDTIVLHLLNPQSTHRIVGSCQANKATITIYDLSHNHIVHTTPTYGPIIKTIICNTQGTRMLVCSHDGCNGTYALWNTENWNDITLIIENHLPQDKTTHDPYFNNAGDRIIIPTQKGSLIFLHSITGDIINQTTPKKGFAHAKMNIIFTPDDYFGIVHTISKKTKSDSVSLWNTATGTLIKYLAWKQSFTKNIRLFPDKSHVIIVFKNRTLKKIPLIDPQDMQCLNVIKKHASMTEMYALYHAYQARINNQQPSADVITLLKQLPKTPCNIRATVLHYLLKATNSAHQATDHT